MVDSSSRNESESVPAGVDLIADEFESAWSESDPPSIENFLNGVDSPIREAALRELVQLDVQCRIRYGMEPKGEDYHGRFEELDTEWVETAIQTARETMPQALVIPAMSALPAGRDGVRIRCPNCHHAIQVVDRAVQQMRTSDVVCPGCGSSVSVRHGHFTSTIEPPRQVGKFEMLEMIGQGAFGEVWKARDTQLNRIVALKIPHGGMMALRDEVERFHREARTAAQLAHPGIVAVYEVADLNGIPAIVSELVDGVPLDEFLAERSLDFRQSATLVAEAADALHYAHSMGAIHRDIKPSNIMIKRHERSDDSPDRVGHVMIMDFGLALRSEAETTMTVEGQVLGTPAYMSPEQAAGRGHGVDGRADVYGLGAVLYQLLCGDLPFRGSRMMLLHQVLFEEPRAPRRVNQHIPRDLETICLKSMAKSPGRRYGSARELSDDLGRWLRGESILARPIRPVARLGRWCRRRPAVAALLAVAVVAVLAGVGGVAWQWRVAEGLRADAVLKQREAEAASAKHRKLWSILVLRLMRDDVRQARASSSAAAHYMDVYRDVVNGGLEFYRSTLAVDPERADIRHENATVLALYAQLHEAVRDVAGARRCYRQSAEQYRILIRAQPNKSAYRDEFINMLASHGSFLMGHGNADVPIYREALKHSQYLVEQEPNNPQRRRNLAVIYDRLGTALSDEVEGLQHLKTAVDILDRLLAEVPTNRDYHDKIAITLSNLAISQQRSGNLFAAQRSISRSVEIAQKLSEENPHNSVLAHNLTIFRRNQAAWFVEAGQYPEADQLYLSIAEDLKRFAVEFPGVVDFRRDLGRSLRSHGSVLQVLQRPDEAERTYLRASRLHQEIWDEDSRDEHTNDQAEIARLLGEFYASEGRHPDAVNAFRQGLKWRQILVDRDPSSFKYQRLVGRATHQLANAIAADGQTDQAAAKYAELLEIRRRLLGGHPSRPETHLDMGTALRDQATFEIGRSNREAARQALVDALRHHREAFRLASDEPDYARELRMDLVALVRLDIDGANRAAVRTWAGELADVYDRVGSESKKALKDPAACYLLSLAYAMRNDGAKATLWLDEGQRQSKSQAEETLLTALREMAERVLADSDR